MKSNKEKVRCSECGKITVGKIPKGGDGSALIPRLHLVEGTDIYCPGSKFEAETIKTPEDKRESPCPECDTGEVNATSGTRPNGSTDYACDNPDCGYTATFP